MAVIEQAQSPEAVTSSGPDNLQVIEGRSGFEHYALAEALLADPAEKADEAQEPSRLRKILGGIAIATKVTLKKGVELGAVGAVGALAGLTWFGAPIDGVPSPGNAKLQQNETIALEATQPNGGEPSTFSFKSPVPFFGARATFELPVEVTKDEITPTSVAQVLGAASLYTNYDQIVDRGVDSGITYGMLYGFLAISGYLGVQIAYQENKNKAWFQKAHVGNIGKIVLIGGLAYSAVSPSTFIETKAVAGTNISSEFPEASSEVGDIKIDGAILDFIQNRREYFEHMSQSQKKALKDISPLFSQEHVVKVLVIEGSGCDTGITRLNGEAADELDPAVVTDAGDREFGNTPFDTFCSKDSGDQLKGSTLLRDRGDHDSSEPYQADWIINLDGNTVEKAGVRFTGIDDPNEVVSGEDKQKAREDTDEKNHGPLTRSEASAALAKQACSDKEKHPKGPSMVFANQGSVVADTVEQECATVVVSGGTEASTDVYFAQDGKVIQYKVPRANGVQLADKPAKGLASIQARLPHKGQISLLGFDMKSGDVFKQSIIRTPEGNVTLGELQYEAGAFIPNPSS